MVSWGVLCTHLHVPTVAYNLSDISRITFILGIRFTICVSKRLRSKSSGENQRLQKTGVRLACRCVCCVAPHLTSTCRPSRMCHRTLSTQVFENECRFSLTSFGVSPPGGVKSRQDWPQALAAFFRSSLARPSNIPKLCIGKTSQYQGEKGEHEGPHLSSDKAERTEMSPSL